MQVTDQFAAFPAVTVSIDLLNKIENELGILFMMLVAGVSEVTVGATVSMV